MPAANRSFYMDMAHGAKYETFIARELPSVIERYFPVCRKRSGRFIAGLSMGGYGTLRLALRYPGRYAAAASLSGCVEMEKGYETFASRGPFMLKELDDVYGSEHDLLRGPGSLFGLADRFLSSRSRTARRACIWPAARRIISSRRTNISLRASARSCLSNTIPSRATTTGLSGTAIWSTSLPGCRWKRRRAYGEEALRHGPPAGGGLL